MHMASDSIYNLENVPLYEAIYGTNLISLGGIEAINNMFSDINLASLTLLDIGFGLGGVAFYLAKKYGIKISGIEIHQWMVDYATARAPKDISPLLHFVTYDPQGNMPFEPASFDLVYSKGVLNHVHDKFSLFQKINQLIKPNGLFVIADWIYPVKLIDQTNPLVNETQESYREILENTGFSSISFRDDSLVFLGYVNQLLENLIKNQTYIEEKFGKEIYDTIWQDHQKLITDVNHKLKFAVRITATKRI